MQLARRKRRLVDRPTDRPAGKLCHSPHVLGVGWLARSVAELKHWLTAVKCSGKKSYNAPSKSNVSREKCSFQNKMGPVVLWLTQPAHSLGRPNPSSAPLIS